jgi:hypothetical protein
MKDDLRHRTLADCGAKGPSYENARELAGELLLFHFGLNSWSVKVESSRYK